MGIAYLSDRMIPYSINKYNSKNTIQLWQLATFYILWIVVLNPFIIYKEASDCLLKYYTFVLKKKLFLASWNLTAAISWVFFSVKILIGWQLTVYGNIPKDVFPCWAKLTKLMMNFLHIMVADFRNCFLLAALPVYKYITK